MGISLEEKFIDKDEVQGLGLSELKHKKSKVVNIKLCETCRIKIKLGRKYCMPCSDDIRTKNYKISYAKGR